VIILNTHFVIIIVVPGNRLNNQGDVCGNCNVVHQGDVCWNCNVIPRVMCVGNVM